MIMADRLSPPARCRTPSSSFVAFLKSALTASYGHGWDRYKWDRYRFLHKWDTDGTGTIQRSEFQSAIRAAGFDAPDHVIDELFDEMDVDGSGTVEYKELRRTLAPSANSSPKQTRSPTNGVEGGKKGGENRGKGYVNGGKGGERGGKGYDNGGKGGEKGGKFPIRHLELVAVPRELQRRMRREWWRSARRLVAARRSARRNYAGAAVRCGWLVLG
jgi:hypothetical protein